MMHRQSNMEHFYPEKKELVRNVGNMGAGHFATLCSTKGESMLFFQRFNGLTPFPFIFKAYTTILHVHL